MSHRFVSPLKDCELFIKDDPFPGKFGSNFNTLFHFLPKHKKYVIKICIYPPKYFIVSLLLSYSNLT